MFSGPGISAFFQPIRAAGTEAVPAQAIAALHKVGDEQKNSARFAKDQEEAAPDTPIEPPPPAADAFTEDHTELSIAALRALLADTHTARAGDDPGRTPADQGAAAEASPVMQHAAAAYEHAAAARPPAPARQHSAGFVPPPRDQATAADILLMLAEIETAGMTRIAVRDGASIYDTLAALCWSLQR